MQHNVSTIALNSVAKELKIFFPSLSHVMRSTSECTSSSSRRDTDYEFCLQQLVRSLDGDGVSHCQLNQLLHLFHEGPISKAFFDHYFFDAKHNHRLHDVKKFQGYSEKFFNGKKTIRSLDHLKWGLHCFYVDALLGFGNIQAAYAVLRTKSQDELKTYFQEHRMPTSTLEARQPCLQLEPIDRENRFYLSEIFSGDINDPNRKTLDEIRTKTTVNSDTTISSVIEHLKSKSIKDSDKRAGTLAGFLEDLMAPFTERLSDTFNETIIEIFEKTKTSLSESQQKGKINNKLYLSGVNELDVYVATSMRRRAEFETTYDKIKQIFDDNRLKHLNLRYFDPTNCFAENPLDKGITECLMVKCAKLLLYVAGDNDSFGKDAEAAIALSLGKPVIMLCENEQRAKIFREQHPLTRLINVHTGVANGAIVAKDFNEVVEITKRIFHNDMQYVLHSGADTRQTQSEEDQLNISDNSLYLKEGLTGSIVRLQTDDQLLSLAFWNNYHRLPERRRVT